LRSGKLKPDDLLVFGTRALLETLQRRGLTCYLASGTDEQFVKGRVGVAGRDALFWPAHLRRAG